MIIIDQTYVMNRSCQSSAQNPIMVLISWIMKVKVFPMVSQVSHDWYNHQSPKSLISSPATVYSSFILHQLQLLLFFFFSSATTSLFHTLQTPDMHALEPLLFSWFAMFSLDIMWSNFSSLSSLYSKVST